MPAPDYRNADPNVAYSTALTAMRNAGFIKSARYQEQQTRALRRGAHPHIDEFARKLVKRGAALGVPLFAHCMVRTFGDQTSAFVRGVSNDDPLDGLWPHKFGAVDIIHGTLGWMDKPPVPHGWDVIGHLGKELAVFMGIKVEWGGDWRFFDPAHWELADWRSLDATRGTKWHPVGEGGV